MRTQSRFDTRAGGAPSARIDRARILAPLLAVSGTIAVVCSCNAMWVTDSPRPTLKQADQFCVSPICPDLVLDSSAIASIEPTVTITARRFETNLGAESVPVDVSIGPLLRDNDGDVPSANADSGADAASSAGGSGDNQCTARSASVACTQGYAAVGPVTAVLFELVPKPGCDQGSTSHLDCTLSPSGEATFGVRYLDTRSPAIAPEYLPICVRPAMDGVNDGWWNTEVRVVPREGTARFAVAIASLAPLAPPPPNGTRCQSLVASCEAPIARVRFETGIVGSDVPDGLALPSDFLDVRRDVTISVAIDTLGAEQAFLSTDPSCSTPDGGAPSPSFPIAQGQRTSAPFFLCAPAKAGSYRLTPTVSTGAATAANDAGATVAGDTSMPVSRPAQFDEPALVQGYAAGDDGVLNAVSCDGQRSPAPATAFQAIAPPLRVVGNTVVLGACEGGAPSAAGDDAGDADAPDALPAADGGTSCAITLSLASGGTCTL